MGESFLDILGNKNDPTIECLMERGLTESDASKIQASIHAQESRRCQIDNCIGRMDDLVHDQSLLLRDYRESLYYHWRTYSTNAAEVAKERLRLEREIKRNIEKMRYWMMEIRRIEKNLAHEEYDIMTELLKSCGLGPDGKEPVEKKYSNELKVGGKIYPFS